jgi:hypothetical protein
MAKGTPFEDAIVERLSSVVLLEVAELYHRIERVVATEPRKQPLGASWQPGLSNTFRTGPAVYV